MKLRHIIIVLACCGLGALLSSFLLTPKTWVVDSKGSKIHFVVPARNHNGNFGGLVCTFRFDPMSPAGSYISASIDVATLSTDNSGLTLHLKKPVYFDAERYPKISFTSDSIVKMNSEFIAFGKLTMKGTVQPVRIPFQFIQAGKKATVKGTLNVLAGDYNVGKKSPSARDHVIITIEVPVTMQ